MALIEEEITASPGVEGPVSEGREIASFTDVSVWNRLAEARSLQDFAEAWLALQCGLIERVQLAVVVFRQDDPGNFKPLCFWPPGQRGSEALGAVAELALQQRRGAVSQQGKEPDTRRDAMAFPLLVDDVLHGVVAVEMPHQSDAELQLAMRQLQWGCAWWQHRLRPQSPPSADLAATLTLMANTMEQTRFMAAATTVTTELAGLLDCELVAYGVRKGRHAQVRALSHSARFSGKSALVRSLGNAMDEAIDQQETLVLPRAKEDEPLITRSHSSLMGERGAVAACSVPLSDGEHLVGCLTLLRDEGAPLSRREIDLFEHVATLVGPLLEARHREDRWIGTKLGESLWQVVTRVFGSGHPGMKLALVALLAVAAFFTFATGMYRVSAPAALQGTVQRVVIAPQDGFVASAEQRAGDLVKEGQELAVLEDKDLALDKLKWEGEREKFMREYSRALADDDRAGVRILGAEIEQAEARIDLLNAQLARTRITAPFDGIVVAGDLSQTLGAPVTRGETLFEIAPLDSYRVTLQVDERDVNELAVGQRGNLALAGLPGESLALHLTKITPVAAVEQGRNVFRVEAALDTDNPALRPGMQGIAKIDIEQRKLLWIWTHKLLYWIRYWWWSWSP